MEFVNQRVRTIGHGPTLTDPSEIDAYTTRGTFRWCHTRALGGLFDTGVLALQPSLNCVGVLLVGAFDVVFLLDELTHR